MNRFVAIVALLSFAVFGYGQSPVTKTRLGSLHPREGLVVTDIDLSATGGGVDTNAVLGLITSATKGLATKADLAGHVPARAETVGTDRLWTDATGVVWRAVREYGPWTHSADGEFEITYWDWGEDPNGETGWVGGARVEGGAGMPRVRSKDPDAVSVAWGEGFVSILSTRVVSGETGAVDRVSYESGLAATVTNAVREVDAKVAAATNGLATASDVESKADKTALDNHVVDKNNPHGVTASQVGALPLSGGTVSGNLTLEVGSGGSSPTLEVSGVSSSGIKLNAEYGGKITVGGGSNGGGQIVLGDSSVTGGDEAEVTIGTVKVRATLAAKQDKLTKDSDPTVGSLLLMGDRPSYGVALDAIPDGTYDALAVKGADNRTSVLTPDGSPVLTQTLGDARYAIAGDLAPLAPESIKKTVDGAKWALSADLVSTKTTTATGEASCTLTTQFGSASLSKIQDRLFSGMLDGVGNVAVWWDGSVWNWGAHPVPSDPSSMQSVSTDPSSDADATSLSFSDGSTATIALGAGTEVVETSHLATVEAVATAYVPVARTVNGKPLSADVVLTAAQVGAYTTGDVDGKLSSKQDALTDAQKAVLNGGPYLGKIGNQKIESDELGHGASLEIGYGSSSGGKLHLRGGPYDGGSIIVEDGGMGTASIKKGGKEVATEAYVDDKVKNAVLPTNPTFSNAVLAVGLNIDTNSVDVLNEIASTFGGFPIEETATTVGGLLAALAAAVAWLRKNKADKATTLAGYGITDAATKTELNAKADKSALAAKADKSTTLAGYGITDGATKTELALKADKTALDDLAAKVEYPLYAVPPTGVLKDRALNTTSLASVTVPDNFTDILIRATVETSLSVTMPEAIATKYGDTFPGEAGEYLITITKTGAAEAYVRTIKLEAANA